MPASFLRRLCGWFVDELIGLVLTLVVDFIFIRPIYLALLLPPGADRSHLDPDALWMAATFSMKIVLIITFLWGGCWAPSVLYYASMESSDWRATLGKRLLKLTVARTDGSPVSFFRSFVRYTIQFVLRWTPFGFILLLPIFGKSQALHDRVCDVIVSEPSATP